MVAKEYIERADALEAVDKRIQMLQKDVVFRKKHGDIDLVGVKVFINAIPAADVRPVVRGKWKRVFTAEIEETVCSVCEHTGFKHLNFCPNCGADMREVQDAR